MRKFLIKRIAKSTVTQRFMKSPTPQWLVFLADFMIVTLSAAITLLCSGVLSTDTDSFIGAFVFKTLCVVCIYTLSFFFIKPYQSIVRLSSIEDTYRVAVAVLLATTILMLFESGFQYTRSHPFIGLWNVTVIGILAFSVMTLMRLVIKYICSAVSALNTSRTRVVVLGSNINSFALASALDSEPGGRFNPVLLLSLTHKNISSTVNGIPIRPYDPDTIKQIFEEYNCDTLLFLSSQIEFIRNGGADVFLNNHIKLLMLNQVEEFDITADSTPTLSPHIQDIKIEDLLGRDPITTDNKKIAANIRCQTIMITGAAGSIGSEIVRQVANLNAGCIVLVDQAETPMHELQLEMEKSFPDAHIELCIADVANHQRMDRIFRTFRPRMVFHAAAYKHVPMMEHNPIEAVTTNVFGTRNLADLSVKYGVERFVMVSTDKAVNPTNIMGASKRIAEIYVQSLAYNLLGRASNSPTRFITTRFGNVLGSNGSVIPLFRKQIENGGPVTVTHRDIIRYFMTIPEACSLVLEAGCMGAGGEIFIFDMGKPIKIYDLATRMISLAGLRPGIDIKIIETGLRPGEKLFEELLNDREKIISTHHKKIMIAKVRVYDYGDVCSRLNLLQQYVFDGDDHRIVAQMKRIVPEYKSQNSEWHSVDTEISQDEVMTEIKTLH